MVKTIYPGGVGVSSPPVRKRVNEFIAFCVARERIRERKESGQYAHGRYTNDRILATYHFCNVRRADDRVTKWIGKWAKQAPASVKSFWFIVARWINEPDTLEALTPAMPRRGHDWNPKLALSILKKMHDNGQQIFRGSYIITGALTKKGSSKYETVVKQVLSYAWKHPPKIEFRSIEASWLELRKMPGMGSFMAGQIVADWQTFGVIDGVDVDLWAPLGPGSRRGLDYIFGRSGDEGSGTKVNQDDAVKEMMTLHGQLTHRQYWLGSTMTLHDVQNCLCEFSKYVRGYAKVKYVPHVEA